jgi:hypothetical protein
MASGRKKIGARKGVFPTSSLGAKPVLEEMENLKLSATVPTDVHRHSGDGHRVHDNRNQTGILEFVDRVEAFGHAGLGTDNARVVSVVVQVNVMVVVIFQPAAVQIEPNNGCNEDDQGHNVVREIHKRLPFFRDLEARRAIVRGVRYSFAGMILLFANEFKTVDDTFYHGKTVGPLARRLKKPSGDNLLRSN